MQKTLGSFEAAREFRTSPVVILRLIAEGKLEARKGPYNRWLITRRSLEAWNEKRLARRARRVSSQAEVEAA